MIKTKVAYFIRGFLADTSEEKYVNEIRHWLLIEFPEVPPNILEKLLEEEISNCKRYAHGDKRWSYNIRSRVVKTRRRVYVKERAVR